MRFVSVLLLSVAVAAGGMTSLKVMPGAREAGMGNVGVASASGASAMAWNPAATAGVRGFAATAGYARWLLDTHQQSLFLVRDLCFLHVGLGVTGFTAGAFEYRADVPSDVPLVDFVPGEYGFRLNIARRLGRVQAGVSARYYYSKVMTEAAGGLGLEAGVRAGPFAGFSAGAALLDFGRNLVYYQESFRLPTRVKAGGAWRTEVGSRSGLEFGVEASYYVYTGAVNAHGGVEFLWNDLLALRGGYEWLDGTSRPGFGLGLVAGSLRFDYSFTPLNDNLGTAHRVAVALGG